ncbi:TonB-dependent receptor [Ravibacter arvi]|uniref:TonB-dependent receptor n=2 Tax=Ravibacter arvi TaxID=2051041 RepID=A0ABP8M4N1_9BACT
MIVAILLSFQILQGGTPASGAPSRGNAPAIYGPQSNLRQAKVSLAFKGAPLRDVLKEIERQTSVSFFFNNHRIDSQRKITFRETGTLEQVMNNLFGSLGIEWKLEDRQIVLTGKARPEPIGSSQLNGRRSGSAVLQAAPAPARSAAEVVKGKVTDESGIGLPGVSILIKNTQRGTTTDNEGNFELEIPDENTLLVFSFVGFATQEVAVGRQRTLSITLVQDEKALDELVVVGYSSKQLSEISSAVATVSGRKLNDVTSNNTTNLLQGKAAGVIVSNASGDPNATSTVIIRGSGSITAGAGPLMVVDGIVGGSANPNDVESVTILKDAAATGLYGSRASNGVIIVTTKSGKSGKPRIDFSINTGTATPTSGNFRVMDSRELYDYTKSFYPTDRFDKDIPSSVLQQNTNWRDLAFRTGITQNYVLSLSGGTEKTRFYTAGNYYYEQGTLRHNSARRFNLRTNITHAINDKLELAVKINLRRNNAEYDPSGLDGALYGAYNNMPWDRPYNADGSVNRGTEGGWFGREQENFLHGWQYNRNNSNQSGADTDVNLTYHISKGLSFSSYNRVSYTSSKSELYNDVRSKAGKGLGRLGNGMGENLSMVSSNRLYYDFNIGLHGFKTLGVVEMEKNRTEDRYTTGEGFAPGLHVMSTASRILSASGDILENSFNKGLVQLDYDYASRYFLSASYIREYSSRFGRNNKAGNFFTLGASWLVSNEDFFDKSTVNLLKLRASYGVTGNAQIDNYKALGLYSYATQYAGNSGAEPFQLENQDLTWEKAKSGNIGVDIGLFNKLMINLDAYQKTTDGLLLNVELPFTSGFPSVTRNVGAIRNKGVEANLTYNLSSGAFTWDAGLNIAFNKSNVLTLNQGKDIRQGNLLISEGKELYMWQMRKWAGVDPANGDPQWEKITTEADGSQVKTITNNYSDATLQVVGPSLPDFTGGMSNTFGYKRFTLNLFFNFVSGNKIYHTSRQLFDSDGAYYTYNSMALADGWSRWQKAGDVATHPKPVFGGNRNSNQASSRYLENGSYLRLRNVSLGYDLPESLLQKIRMKHARLSVSADNLLTFTKFSGMDPEVVIGSGGGSSSIKYPISRKVMFGINVGF